MIDGGRLSLWMLITNFGNCDVLWKGRKDGRKEGRKEGEECMYVCMYVCMSSEGPCTK